MGKKSKKKQEKIDNMASCMLSVLDYLKLQDNSPKGGEDMLTVNKETLSEMLFREMRNYDINLNEELGFTHLEPVKYQFEGVTEVDIKSTITVSGNNILQLSKVIDKMTREGYVQVGKLQVLSDEPFVVMELKDSYKL